MSSQGIDRRTLLAGASASALAFAAQPASAQSAYDALIAAAKAEGSVIIDGPPDADGRAALTGGFQRAFGIPVSYVPSGSSSSSARIRAERAAGKYVLDVFVNGADAACLTFLPSGWLDKVEPVLVAPDVVDKRKWKDGHLWWEDEGHTILKMFQTVAPGLAVNTKYVQPRDVPTWKSLLEPKWQGKIVAKDPMTYGAGSQINSYLLLEFGADYVKKMFTEQKPVLSRNGRQAIQWLADGTYPIVMGPDTAQMNAFKKLGYPLQVVVPSDGPSMLNCGWGLVCLMNKAPHPNAAKLFVNWLVSKAGQDAFASPMQSVSLRTDVTYQSVPSYLFPQRNKKYLDTSDWQFVTQTHQSTIERVQQLLGSG